MEEKPRAQQAEAEIDEEAGGEASQEAHIDSRDRNQHLIGGDHSVIPAGRPGTPLAPGNNNGHGKHFVLAILEGSSRPNAWRVELVGDRSAEGQERQAMDKIGQLRSERGIVDRAIRAVTVIVEIPVQALGAGVGVVAAEAESAAGPTGLIGLVQRVVGLRG